MPPQSRNRTTLTLLALAALSTPLHAQLSAFPGAQDSGAYATGGRGGDVYHVTTLADDPNHAIPGSLFYGLYDKNVPAAGRTIVFDVGGVINLGSSTLDIKNIKNVTIAGHTAPSPITIVGNTVQITSSGGKETSNIILQHVAIRKGLANSGDALSIKGSGNTHNIMIDHVSGSWSEDEVISVGGATNSATNVTVQFSTLSEALTNGHQYGSLIRSRENSSVSYVHNLYSNNASRNPRPGSYLGTTLQFEFQNNVIYNWSQRAGYTGGSGTHVEPVYMNYTGNYLVAGPSTPNTDIANAAFVKDLGDGHPLDLQVYQAGNKIDLNRNATRDGADTGWGMFIVSNTTPLPDADKRATPWLYPAANTADSADLAYARVLAAVGAVPHMRTATDQRLVNEVMTHTGTAAQSAPNATEWTNLLATPTVSRPANWDTDRDGMPNHWEALRGSNPAAADNNALTPSGYTRLEKYLHSLAATAHWNLDADGNWSDHLNWRGHRPDKQDATALFPAGTTAPRTVSVDFPVALTDLSLAGTQPYTLAGPHSLSLNAFAGSAAVSVPSGSHHITAPLYLGSPTLFDLTGDLTLTTPLPSPAGLTKLGPGTLRTGPLSLPSLTLAAGTLQLLPDTGPTALPTLTLSPTSTLDLTNNPLSLQLPPGAPHAHAGLLSQIRDNLLNDQLVSSLSTNTHSLGYLATDSTLTVKLTLTGDANLDGQLNADDYTLLDRSFARNMTNAHWSDGDFNYDGTIDQQDYLLIDTTFQTQARSSLTPALLSQRESQFGPAYVHQLLTAIPEPSALACLFAIYPLLPRTRRKS